MILETGIDRRLGLEVGGAWRQVDAAGNEDNDPTCQAFKDQESGCRDRRFHAAHHASWPLPTVQLRPLGVLDLQTRLTNEAVSV